MLGRPPLSSNVSHSKESLMKVIIATFITSLFLSGASFAGILKSEADLLPLSDGIMQSVAKGDIAKAFEKIKPYTIIPPAEFDSVAFGSISQRDQFGIRYGKTVGYEFISNKKVGNSLIKITYIEKTEKHALPWSFYFYKTPDGWVLNSFSWNDQMPQLFLTE